ELLGVGAVIGLDVAVVDRAPIPILRLTGNANPVVVVAPARGRLRATGVVLRGGLRDGVVHRHVTLIGPSVLVGTLAFGHWRDSVGCCGRSCQHWRKKQDQYACKDA